MTYLQALLCYCLHTSWRWKSDVDPGFDEPRLSPFVARHSVRRAVCFQFPIQRGLANAELACRLQLVALQHLDGMQDGLLLQLVQGSNDVGMRIAVCWLGMCLEVSQRSRQIGDSDGG